MDLSRFLALRIYRNSDAEKKVSRPAVLIATLGIAIGLAVMIIAVSVIIGFKSEAVSYTHLTLPTILRV